MAQSYGGSGCGTTVQSKGPFGSVKNADKISSMTMSVAAWKGFSSPFSQTVEVNGISSKSIVLLLPGPEQLQYLFENGTALVAENDDGTVTVHAIGNRPTRDITIQVAIQEVIVI